jgi:hypothetical protein
MRHHAAALSAHQALTDTLTFNVDAVFNKRWVRAAMPPTRRATVGQPCRCPFDQPFRRNRAFARAAACA